jgi:homogentisate 1,2-dioxygenase|tara:strand:+ start:11266 stop:12594 length:1329 start_codon:yes stop_codon:yes gene_type:complete
MTIENTRKLPSLNERKYMTGLGNELQSEAELGAVPIGCNSPQNAPLGLYTEKFSATAFTAPKAHNFRTWFYRIQPSVSTLGFQPLQHSTLQVAPIIDAATPPDPMRWSPYPVPDQPLDFIDGLYTIAGCGDAGAQIGSGIHIYRANRSMEDRYFYNCDGEMLIVPESGTLSIHTECGVLDVAPESIAIIPRGMKFRVVLQQGQARGYICENYGAIFELPERGPIGSDSLANSRDFEIPVAAYEDREGDLELVCKLDGKLFSANITHSPLDVVGWHGSIYPYRYDLNRFNAIGSISYDHPDPSIFTVLTSASDTPGWANLDFVIFAPRWLVAENTFRPPWYHRNVMSEYMGLISGVYDGKTGGGFTPGASSLHHCMVPHGPDEETYQRASTLELKAEKVGNGLAFMFESRYLIKPTKSGLEAEQRQLEYPDTWAKLPRNFKAP